MNTPYFQRMLFRPTPQPGIALPMGARSVGHYRVAPGWRDSVRVKPFAQLFWGIVGTGALVIDGEEEHLHPGQVALYPPGSEHRVYSLNEDWEYRWCTMDGPLVTAILTSFRLSSGVCSVGAVPEALFSRLESAIRRISRRGELRAAALAYELLTLAAGINKIHENDPHVRQGLESIHRNWQSSKLNVKTLAHEVRLHRSLFTKRFIRAMGMPPGAYIRQLRIQEALSLLKQTEEPVAQIAQQCGYADSNYFSRLMKRTFGLSPLQLRESELI